jgi:membrane protein implicated in regulation of membrane protease activity
MDFFKRPSVHLFKERLSGRVESEVTVNKRGRVKCQGVSWTASLYSTDNFHRIEREQAVDVIGREGNTLLILPEQKNGSDSKK